MRTLVNADNFDDVLAELQKRTFLVFDVETTGLNPHQSAKMFSMAMADLEGNAWYFNFKAYPGQESGYVLSPADLKPLFDNENVTWVAHNAKFDMHFADKAGICPAGQVIDTKAMARLFENNHGFTTGGYSLEACAERWLDQKKDDRVKAWMDENGAYAPSHSYYKPIGKNYFFDMVPFELISEYAMIDAEVTAKLYLHLRQKMYSTSMVPVEFELTKVLFEMERRGVLMDREYCKRAYRFERLETEEALRACEALMPNGQKFKDHANTLAPIFKANGFELSKTDKGNFQVTDKFLKSIDHDLAKAVIRFRTSQKRMNTNWTNYIFLMDREHVLHTSFDQSGTVTGRMSCKQPNLQNIPADEDSPEFPIRRAFLPRPGFTLVSIDYKAVEFRLALEYAGELDLIERIKQGHDPHQAAADLTGLSRKQAKVFNFATLYGAGVAKLAGMLQCSNQEAEAARNEYFAGLPRLKSFMDRARDKLKKEKAVVNVYGRKYLFETFFKDGRMNDNSYKACNLIIQGSSADIMKRAMVTCSKILKTRESKILLTIHDEIIFEVSSSEMQIIPVLKQAMESAYQYQLCPLECSVETGPNLHDMEAYQG